VSLLISIVSLEVILEWHSAGFKTDELKNEISGSDKKYPEIGELEVSCSGPADASSPCTIKLVEKRRHVKTVANVNRYSTLVV
jgi:hypothetical protein